MEKIDKDYKRRPLKIYAKGFKMGKPIKCQILYLLESHAPFSTWASTTTAIQRRYKTDHY